MNPKRVSIVAIAAVLLAACQLATESAPAATAPPPQAIYSDATLALLDDYQRQAQALSQALAGATIDASTQTTALALIDLAAEITPAFVQRHPECRDYLDAALAVRGLWQSLDAATLERDYHDDGALPTQGITPACYHMKDLIVHPATALVLATQPTPDPVQARREIDEVLAHIGVVRAG